MMTVSPATAHADAHSRASSWLLAVIRAILVLFWVFFLAPGFLCLCHCLAAGEFLTLFTCSYMYGSYPMGLWFHAWIKCVCVCAPYIWVFVGVIAAGLSASEVQGNRRLSSNLSRFLFRGAPSCCGWRGINRLCFILDTSVFPATSPAY